MLHSPGTFSIYHLVHPRPVPWRALFRPIAATLDIRPMPYHMWFRRLMKSKEWFSNSTPEQEVEQMRVNPALKLMDFFETAGPVVGSTPAGAVHDDYHDDGPVKTKDSGIVEVNGAPKQLEGRYEALGLPRLSVSEAERAAPSLRPETLPQLTEQDAMKWLQYWRSIGYLR